MSAKGYTDETQRALARPDADRLIRQIDAYIACFAKNKCRDWPDERVGDFDEIVTCYRDDPDKALAYVVIAASRTDDAEFLAFMSCGSLEDVLRKPSPSLVERIAAEARKSPRFRWLLSHPFRAAIADEAWAAIERFRVAGPHEEPPLGTLPPR